VFQLTLQTRGPRCSIFQSYW